MLEGCGGDRYHILQALCVKNGSPQRNTFPLLNSGDRRGEEEGEFRDRPMVTQSLSIRSKGMEGGKTCPRKDPSPLVFFYNLEKGGWRVDGAVEGSLGRALRIFLENLGATSKEELNVKGRISTNSSWKFCDFVKCFEGKRGRGQPKVCSWKGREGLLELTLPSQEGAKKRHGIRKGRLGSTKQWTQKLRPCGKESNLG